MQTRYVWEGQVQIIQFQGFVKTLDAEPEALKHQDVSDFAADVLGKIAEGLGW